MMKNLKAGHVLTNDDINDIRSASLIGDDSINNLVSQPTEFDDDDDDESW